MKEDRDYYKTDGIDLEAIRSKAQENANKNPDAFIVIHFHAYHDRLGNIPPCNEACYRVKANTDDA